MGELTNISRFYDTGNKKREKENFQNFLFEGIDTRDQELHISFYRSDFRGARLLNNYFFKNNFSNADFIDCYFHMTSFQECRFQSTEFYNSYFDNSNFTSLTFSSSSIVRIVFDKVKMNRINFRSSNIQDSKFIDCEIDGCSFQKTTIDELTFENTYIKDADLSPMTAINIYFNNCKFENVTIDADYLGSYFFKGRFFEELNLRYRGKAVKLEIDRIELIANLFKLMLEKKRFYEATNLVVQRNLIDKKATPIYPIIKYAFSHLLQESNALIRTYQISKIFSLFEYYFNSGYIKLKDYYRFINYFEGIDISQFNISEQIDLLSKNERLKNLLKLSVINTSMFDDMGKEDTMYLEIIVDENDQAEFEDLLNSILTKWTGVDVTKDNIYLIIGKRKGSIIYEIIILASIGMLLINLFRKSLINRKKNDLISGLKTQIAEKVLKNINTEIEKADFTKLGLKEQLEIVKLVSEFDNERLTNDKSVQQFLSIMKSIEGHPTTLNN